MSIITVELNKYHGSAHSVYYHRYLSWDYCFEQFAKARTKRSHTPAEIDYLALHLAEYLASWGMYRKSFLLQCNYKVHIEIVKIILDPKYDVLLNIDCNDLKDAKNLAILFDLVKAINDYYAPIKSKITGKQTKKISDTLITKILLGTLGCVPAYDKNLKMGLKGHSYIHKFGKNSIIQLCDFYYKNFEEFEAFRKSNKTVSGSDYPQMKLIDMYFWQYGVDYKFKSVFSLPNPPIV